MNTRSHLCLLLLLAIGLTAAVEGGPPADTPLSRESSPAEDSQPRRLNELLATMAEQLATELKGHNQKRAVGVLEFTNITDAGEHLGSDCGLLGQYCAIELVRLLTQRSDDTFSMLSHEELQQALKRKQISVGAPGSNQSIVEFIQATAGLSSLVVGSLKRQENGDVIIRCTLRSNEKQEDAPAISGIVRLTLDEWAMLGRSVVTKPDDYSPLNQARGGGQSIADQVIQNLQARSAARHPFADPAFPFRLRIMVDGRERPGTLRGNDFVVTLNEHEVFEIWVENRSGDTALMRLLIDGRNTRLEEEETRLGSRGAAVFATRPVVGMVVDLNHARPWILDPNREPVHRVNGHPTWAVRGFQSAPAESGQAKLREFTVISPPQSYQQRQSFSESPGLITAAFYRATRARSASGAVAVVPGRERDEKIETVTGYRTGGLIGVVHIRYTGGRSSVQ